MKIGPNIKDSDNTIKSKIFQESSWEIIFPLLHNENNKKNQLKTKNINKIIVNNSNSKIKKS